MIVKAGKGFNHNEWINNIKRDGYAICHKQQALFMIC